MDTIFQNLPSYIDYNWLMSALQNYASPRVKINALLKKGEIIRIKKGIYIPGKKYKRNISRGVLANLIYGPSYVSYEYALSWHGLIPERVYSIASACTKRKKEFITPIGAFWYYQIPEKVFPLGVEMAIDVKRNFLVATPEKALADRIATEKHINTVQDVENFLDGLRIDFSKNINGGVLRSIANNYCRKPVHLLADYIQETEKKYE